MIIVDQLSKRFTSGSGKSAKTVQAVASVQFEASDGAITGLLGPNGAGKTTTLRMIAGLIEPDSGSVSIDGIDVAKDPYQALARMGVLSDSRGLYPRLSARENIEYYGRLHGMAPNAVTERANEVARMLDMQSLMERRTEGFSQGERMKTALARALIHDPPNIILDEPTNGLDVLATRSLRESLRLLRELGKCVVISTHIMQEVERLCDDVVIVSHGRTVARGTVSELKLQANDNDFEEAFVKLAFGEQSSVRPL